VRRREFPNALTFSSIENWLALEVNRYDFALAATRPFEPGVIFLHSR